MTADEIREESWQADELLNAENGVIDRLKKYINENLRTMKAEKAVKEALRRTLNEQSGGKP